MVQQSEGGMRQRRTMSPLAALWAGLTSALLLGATPAAAQDAVPISPSAFREYAEGYTLYFSHEGAEFGAESFLSGDRSIWRYDNGECVNGTWHPRGAQICFSYEDNPQDLCWRFLRAGDDLLARLLGDGPDAGMELRVVRRDRFPLLCAGPGA